MKKTRDTQLKWVETVQHADWRKTRLVAWPYGKAAYREHRKQLGKPIAKEDEDRPAHD